MEGPVVNIPAPDCHVWQAGLERLLGLHEAETLSVTTLAQAELPQAE